MYKKFFLILSFVAFLTSCTTTPFTELNSRDNFQLEEGTSFKIQLNKDFMPVEMDPILIENLGDAVLAYLEGVGHQSSKDASLSIDISVTTKDKIKYDDFGFYRYPVYRSYLYEPDRISSVPEFFLRVSLKDEVSDKTLWTGLTKWRKGSSYAPTDIPSAEMLVENLLVNL
jgi:hypothetical protein